MNVMARWILIVLVLAFGAHHTGLGAAAPVVGHHGGACPGCVDDHPADATSTMALAACLALLATAIGVPSLRRRLVRILVVAAGRRGRTVSDPVTGPRAPANSRSAPVLSVLRC
jgi:hypothetical protein